MNYILFPRITYRKSFWLRKATRSFLGDLESKRKQPFCSTGTYYCWSADSSHWCEGEAGYVIALPSQNQPQFLSLLDQVYVLTSGTKSPSICRILLSPRSGAIRPDLGPTGAPSHARKFQPDLDRPHSASILLSWLPVLWTEPQYQMWRKQ